MELTKTEMEKIWSEQPYGAFRSMKSRLKGRKKYEIVVEPFVKSYLPSQSFVVYAKNYNAACDEASAQFWAKNRENSQMKADGFRYKQAY